MAQITLEISDAELRRLKKRAEEIECTAAELAKILLAKELSVAAFPTGHIREGCERLQSILMALPGTRNWKWASIDKRYWWVSFTLAKDTEHYQRIVNVLAAYLNTDVLQSWGIRPFVFTPECSDEENQDIEWKLETTVPMIEPTEVAVYLEGRLPANYGDERSWRDFTPHL